MLYIRTQPNKLVVNRMDIIKGFSDVFETPIEGDICIDESDTRHFQIAGEINPLLMNLKGQYLYWYDPETKEIGKKTEEELKWEQPVPAEKNNPEINTEEKIKTLTTSLDFILFEALPALMP